ncbi:MAG: hypothetical protein JO331_00990 [Verrucomicrobia bacterium]|nr:hypothetical protein [Verrucomicrobiota bacterium]
MWREADRETKRRPEVPDSLVEPLRRIVIAVEWFRAAYPLKENRRENRLLYQQLAEMKRQIELLEAEFCKDEDCG